MNDLETFEQLKNEEKRIVKTLALLKAQLNALKVEELELKNRLRHQTSDSRKQKFTQSNDLQPNTSTNDRTNVNDTILNLNVNPSSILHSHMASERSMDEQIIEEEDSDEDNNEDPLMSFLD